MAQLVYLDAGVLIAAVRGNDELADQAIRTIDDPNLAFASSAFVQLEVLPKAVYHERTDEAAFYKQFFRRVSVWATPGSRLTQLAYSEAARHGLSALDALHVASAKATGAIELVTTEALSKPIHRTTLVRVRAVALGQ